MPAECSRPSRQDVQRLRGRNLPGLLGDVVREVGTESGKTRYEGRALAFTLNEEGAMGGF